MTPVPPVDFDEALKALQDGQALIGKDGIFTLLIKQLIEVHCLMNSTLIWLETLKSTEKRVHSKKRSKRQPVPLNWLLPVTKMALLNLIS
ncbi:hypothetical protein M5J15_10160 [Serratia symbiotica]|nr:hypothetical protein [Serratia symbiotica]USS95048.1 hypothetical protein M5J15_10160 [Serratia symbiotica]